MVAAILSGRDGVWPASLVLDGEYGVEGVAVSVPVTLGPAGAEAIHEWDLTEAQRASLHEAAELVRSIVAGVSS